MTQGAETLVRAQTMAVVCPECGAPADSKPCARSLRVGWVARLLPWLAALILAGVIVGGAVRSSQRIGGLPGSTLVWATCPARVTTGELARIASGRDDGARLAEWLAGVVPRHGWATRTGHLQVRLSPPAGTRIELSDFGWPTIVASRVRETQYRDAYTCSEPVARDRGGDYPGLTWRLPSMEGGGLTVTADHLETNAPRLALWTCCWLLLGWVLPARVVACWARARRRGPRKIRGRTRLAIAGAAGLVLASLSLVAPKRVTWIDLHDPTTAGAPSNSSAGPSIDTNLGAQEVAWMLATDGGVRDLASALVGVLPREDTDRVVQFGVNYPSVGSLNMTLRGWPDEWLVTTAELRSSEVLVWTSGARIELDQARDGWLSLARADDQERTTVSVILAGLAPVVLLSVVLWHVLRGTGLLLEWLRARRRHAAGLCMGCGYDLAGLRRSA